MIILEDDVLADEKDPLLGLSDGLAELRPPDDPSQDPPPRSLAAEQRSTKDQRKWTGRYVEDNALCEVVVKPAYRKLLLRFARAIPVMVFTVVMLVLFARVFKYELRPVGRRPSPFIPWRAPFARHRRFPPAPPRPVDKEPPQGTMHQPSGPELPMTPFPLRPSPDHTAARWGVAAFCNNWQAPSTAVSATLLYALNDTGTVTVNALGRMNGTFRIELAERLNAEVEMNVTGERDGLNACLLSSDDGTQGLGVWGPPYILAEDGTGLMKNCSGHAEVADVDSPGPTVDLVLRLPFNASVKTLDAFLPSMSVTISSSASAFTFDYVTIYAGGHILLEGLQSIKLQASTAGADIRGQFSAVQTFLQTDGGSVWTNITVPNFGNSTASSIALVTRNAPILASISGARPGLNVTTSTTNATVNVAYVF